MKRILTYFGRGLLFLVPLAATVYAIYWVFSTIDGFVRKYLAESLGFKLSVGLGVVITFSVIVLLGFLSSLFITRPIMQLFEKVIRRVPLVKLLYSAVKDMVGAFVGDEKKFTHPVLVTLIPAGDVKALGFITRESMADLGMPDEVAVYFPQSYNFAGSVLLMPRSQVKVLDADSSDVMAFIVSAGVSGGVSLSGHGGKGGGVDKT